MSTFEIDRHADELERNGYTILKNVLPVSEIQATKLAIKETLSYEETVGRKYGLQSDNLLMAFNAQAKHPHFRSMPLRYPAPAEVARRVLGEDMFWPHVVIRTPLPSGAKDHQKYGGNLHADWVDFTVKPFIGGRHFPMAIQSVWAIEEFTRETGGPLIWPGTHQSLEVPPEEPDQLPPGWRIAEAPAGSVVMWDSALWHSGGINISDKPRYSLIFLLPALVDQRVQRFLPLYIAGGAGHDDGRGVADVGAGARHSAEYPLPGHERGADHGVDARGKGRAQHSHLLMTRWSNRRSTADAAGRSLRGTRVAMQESRADRGRPYVLPNGRPSERRAAPYSMHSYYIQFCPAKLASF